MANSVDVAITKLRELQHHLYSYTNSRTDLFNFINKEIMPAMDQASRSINANYEEISKKLTAEMNTGKKQ